MFASTRWNALNDIFNFQREADRLWGRIGSGNFFPTPSTSSGYPVQVDTNPDYWLVNIPMPGIDPKLVSVDVTDDTIIVRAEQNGGRHDGELQYQRTFTVPEFLDLDQLKAAHRYGMLELTLPLKDTVKPRHIVIEGVAEQPKQLATA